jgi:uncharacterized protein (DUF488 family)
MTTIFTIGHSTRPIEAFIAMLEEAGVSLLADVRRFPASRRHPQFNAVALRESLPARGIAYRHFEALGGRRDPRPDSPNTLWREAGFRGYADYAATAPFRTALDELEALARAQPCAVMCAEALWWQCHRRIVADYLIADGFEVRHILDADKIEPAQLTPGAHIAGGAIAYPATRDPRGHVGDLFDPLAERPC